jgi:hypothetical protein
VFRKTEHQRVKSIEIERKTTNNNQLYTPLLGVKGIQAVRIDFFLFLLKVANIRCFILIKCSEQEARFKKYVIMS